MTGENSPQKSFSDQMRVPIALGNTFAHIRPHTTIHNMQVLVCAPDGKKLKSEPDALDLIGEAIQQGCDLILVTEVLFPPPLATIRQSWSSCPLEVFWITSPPVLVDALIIAHSRPLFMLTIW